MIDCGPFRALLDPTSDMIWINYAVPIGAIDDAQADHRRAAGSRAGLLRRTQRRPRFEFNALPWPALPSLLESVTASNSRNVTR